MASVSDPANVGRATGPRKAGNEAESLSSQSIRAGFGQAKESTINDFLDGQPQQTLVRLYQRPCNALAIFRLLPPMARQMIMHLLFLDVPLSREEYLPWIKKGNGKREYEIGLKRLEKLHILKEQGGKFLLSGVFQENFQRALLGGGSHRSFGVPFDNHNRNEVDVKFLDDYARRSWEAILHYMVGSRGIQAPRGSVLYLLRRSNLMKSSESVSSSNKLEITSRGFQFLLEDVNTQLWDLLLQYLALADSRRMDLVEILSFLFMLGSLTLGQAYSTEDLPPTQLHCLEDFRDYGLVYQTTDKRCFWPTRLATTLTNNDANTQALTSGNTINNSNDDSNNSGEVQVDESKGFIVLETNYRLYAYTSNPLRIAVLELFVHIKSQFPNLILGTITRESIKSALNKGISSEQIITYLSHHAHPQMVARNDPLLPITVTDQIRLWEREKNRVQDHNGYLYMDFTTMDDFKLVRDYAKSLAVLLWQDEERKRFFVEARGHEPVRDFIQRRLQ
ncbi:unnamed protein product [Sympodiomycopsis kandeliae]